VELDLLRDAAGAVQAALTALSRSGWHGGVPEFLLPPSDEPVDFRRQATVYARYRPDYSPGLYAAIEARTGPGGGRCAVDLGCGTGFVAAELARRGWNAVGIDFSAPMLAEASRLAGGGVPLLSARAEALPVAGAALALVTSGTAFHWFAPAPALAEIERVLVAGGWAAIFWRYDAPGQPYMELVAEVLAEFGVTLPDIAGGVQVHAGAPFTGSGLAPVPTITLASEVAFTAESFCGYVSTLEWIRRFAGSHHAEFLARLRRELDRRWPEGFSERQEEYLFLACNPERRFRK